VEYGRSLFVQRKSRPVTPDVAGRALSFRSAALILDISKWEKKAREVCYHFATQPLNTGQDRAVLDDQRPAPKPNKISHIDINDDYLGRQEANCKTVYTSSILVVASTLQINVLSSPKDQRRV
jgi:hypothetical protein